MNGGSGNAGGGVMGENGLVDERLIVTTEEDGDGTRGHHRHPHRNRHHHHRHKHKHHQG